MSPAEQNTVTGGCLNEKLPMWEGEEDACCLMHHPSGQAYIGQAARSPARCLPREQACAKQA